MRMIPAGPATAPSGNWDLAVVGAGILGLAVARELAHRHPGLSLVVLEKEGEPGLHQTSHNSGVIHGGIYYPPGSLKARLCVDGARRLYDYCEERGLPVQRCGKLIVAVDPAELPRLDELERRGRANGVSGLQRLGGRAIPDIEPHARGISALHSPNTGVVDFSSVARAYGSDVEAATGVVATGCELASVARAGQRVALRHSRGEVRARHAVFCAGLWSDRLAVAAGASEDPRIVPFRGAYLRLRFDRRHLVRSLIYPTPDPRLPFLGVHLSRHIDGNVLLGPTALLSPSRAAYRLRDVRWNDLRATLGWPGTWRLAQRFWRAAATEMRYAVCPRAFLRAVQAYVPEIEAQDVEPAFAGVRAQALGRDGRLIDDFVFAETENVLHVRNAPSPAATASLAIASMIADRADRAFSLGSP